MSIGIFMLVKNEEFWIGPWLKHLLPHVDEFVLFDGNSQDATLEIIDDVRRRHDAGGKIRLFLNRDPRDLQDSYTNLFDRALRELRTDLAWFLHPDMWVCNPEKIPDARKSEAIALSCRMRSFAGDMAGPWYEIKGRAAAWKNIYRLRNPSLGAHYYGHYGAPEEDVYFRAITGDSHDFYGQDFKHYPYAIEDSGLDILHFSDVRPRDRRLGRMRACLINQGHMEVDAERLAAEHPRVTLQNGMGMFFIPADGPDYFEYVEARREFDGFLKVNA